MVKTNALQTFGICTVLSVWVQQAQSHFFVCPSPCEALYLPIDMDSIDDCFCDISAQTNSDHSTTTAAIVNSNYFFNSILSSGRSLLTSSNTTIYHCPPHSSATQIHPSDFNDCLCHEGFTRIESQKACVHTVVCEGRYKLKEDIIIAQSIADCTCQDPYVKDDSTGECYLSFCPRAANYVQKPTSPTVHSLMDCDCVSPYIKNPQSGECYYMYECPSHSKSVSFRIPKTIEDCICEYGYIRQHIDSIPMNFNTNMNTNSQKEIVLCVKEKQSYQCPPNSTVQQFVKDNQASSFKDCVCLPHFIREDNTQQCILQQKSSSLRANDQAKKADNAKELNNIFECPQFAIPLSPYPYSMAQCICLPGFEINFALQSCDWNPNIYKCPPHSYNPYPPLHELEFYDCKCAKGYIRNDLTKSCDPIPLMEQNGCPQYGYIKHYPVRDVKDCGCLYGEDVDANTNGMMNPYFKDFEHFTEYLTCQPPPTTTGMTSTSLIAASSSSSSSNTILECPPNSVLNHYPVTSFEHCACNAGFIEQLNSTTDQMQCIELQSDIDTKITIDTPCLRSGEVRSRQDLRCHYPSEIVTGIVSNTYTNSDNTKRRKIVLHGNEIEFVLVENNIMVTQGDIAVGEMFGMFDSYNDEDDDDIDDDDDGEEESFDYTTDDDNISSSNPDYLSNRVQQHTKKKSITKENKDNEEEEDQLYLYLLHGYYNLEKDTRWKNHTMCYVFNSGINTTQQQLVHNAMTHITTNTGFQFIQCFESYCDDHLQTLSCMDYIEFLPTKEPTCYSFIGRIGGLQTLGVGAQCYEGNMIHAILHAIGLHHPIVRPDRNEYIQIIYECIEDTKYGYFMQEGDDSGGPTKNGNDMMMTHFLPKSQTQPTQQDKQEQKYHMKNANNAHKQRLVTNVPYDYYSIMHHAPNTFVKTSLPTCLSFVPLISDNLMREDVIKEMGQRDKMSQMDVHYVWAFYPELKDVNGNTLTNPNNPSNPNNQPKSMVEDTSMTTSKNVQNENSNTNTNDVHQSRIHVKSDAVKVDGNKWKLSNWFGPLICILAFIAIIGFLIYEVQRLRRKKGIEDGMYYNDPLLSDPVYD